MKGRIVIKDEIFADFLIKNKDNHNISASPKVIMDRCIVEQVPETWEELKELCKGRNKIRIANVEGTESIILNDNLICDKYGNVFADFSEHTYCFAQNRTIPQLWSFIKSLIGEE